MPTVFERAKRLVETEPTWPAERRKHNDHWVEVMVPGEHPERSHRQRDLPAFPIRPLHYDTAVPDCRKSLLVKILLPDRAVRIHDQGIAAARTPRRPHSH